MLKTELRERLLTIEEYFVGMGKNNALFHPEAAAAAAINPVLCGSAFTQHDALQLIAVLEAAEQELHYDGSAWLDYKLSCKNALQQLGFDTEAERIQF
ncbi:hypothetical protein [Hymenobacter crusticola]|uniref:Uncharacterized protein n=1 Tax=Hymenobacter crusticola TaxID=1770526 RepID=A0A243W5A7_9BACT|nr:hypothetical protein [Hymenobacter crusticola]OUJ68583.1 hypothetical protein BXP70_27875 [Hymenobacter crusticola]